MAGARQRDGDAIGRLRRVGEACLWVLVIGAAVAGALWLASRLRLVFLPVFLAVILATLLVPPVEWLKRRGWPDGAAAFAVLVLAVASLGAVVALMVPRTVDQFDQLDVGLTGGIQEVQDWLADGPLQLSERQIDDAFDQLQEEVRDHLGSVGTGALTGAVVLLEALAGLVLTLVVLFFFLKDGAGIWRWLSGLAPPHRRAHVEQAGARSWQALAGFLRGQTIVALFDAVFIGLALVVIGVPLVLPLVVLTFFGAYVPILGATVAGLAAVLVALFDQGPVAAALVLAAIIVVQQLEGNVFQPFIVGRSVDVHPLAILLGVTAGAVLAGVIGAMIAAPLVAVAGAILRYAREGGDAWDRAEADGRSALSGGGPRAAARSGGG
jgi:putative heme transporter